MFKKSKSIYEVVVICKNGDKEGRYIFVEDCDSNWDDIAERKFFDEFNVNPTEMHLESRTKL